MAFEDSELSQAYGAPLEYYKFTVGTTVYRVTSSDRLATIDEPGGSSGVQYTPLADLSRTAMDYSREDTAQNLQVGLPTEHAIGQLFIGPMPTTPVALVIYQKHRNDAEIITGFVGVIVSARHQSGLTTLVAAGPNHNLLRIVPSLAYQSQCNWALYSPECGVDVDDFTESATLTAVAGLVLEADEFADQVDGWFTNGWVQLADGSKRYIVEHVGNQVTLLAPFPPSLTTGTVVSIVAGCMRDEVTCFDKFSNLDNHLGFARIPGRNPHNGELV